MMMHLEFCNSEALQKVDCGLAHSLQNFSDIPPSLDLAKYQIPETTKLTFVSRYYIHYADQ